MINISSPKRQNNKDNFLNDIYPYYAGYSPKFVFDTLTSFKLKKGSFILDPWNGSGTTTRVASKLGYKSIGFDINPVMVIVSRTHEIDRNSIDSVIPLSKEIEQIAKNCSVCIDIDKDPLITWMVAKSVTGFRKIEYAVQRLLLDYENYVSLSERKGLSNVSSITAFFYVALFRTLKLCLLF